MSVSARRVALLATVLAVVAGAGIATANDGQPGTVTVAGESVQFDQSVIEPGDDDTRRTMYFDGDVLVAAAWDRDGDGRDDLWFRVDADWYVDRQAIDDTGDGRVDRAFTIARDGTVTPTELGGSGFPAALMIGGVAVVAVAAGVLLALRRRDGARKALAATSATVLLIPLLLAVPADTPWANAQIYDENCVIDETLFDAEWQKYSDLDSHLPETSRSPEAQRVALLAGAIEQLFLDNVELQMDMRWEHEELAELRQYREALTRDIRRNLVRSFIRLSILTYSTTKSGLGLRQSAERLLTSPATLQVFGAAVNIVRNFQPALDNQKASVRRAMANVGWDGLVDAMESLGEAGSLASATAQSAIKQVWDLIPSVDITDEEANILRDQHLGQKDIDRMMLEAERRIAHGRDLVARNEAAIAEFYADMEAARGSEKERVRQAILGECERLRERREAGDEELDDEDPLADTTGNEADPDDADDPLAPTVDGVDEMVLTCSANDALDVAVEVTAWDASGGWAERYSATLTIANVSNDGVQLGLRSHAVLGASPDIDQWVIRTPLGPGEQRTESLTAAFNAGRSGIATWVLVTHVVGYWDDPACLSAYDPLSPAQLESVAIAVPNPFPYGP